MSIVFCDRATAFGDIAWLRGAGCDPDIPEGIHWHVTMGRDGGLPAGPTVIVDLRPNSDSCHYVGLRRYFGQGGPGSWQIDADQGHDLTLVFEKPSTRSEVLGWAFIQGDRELTLSAADPLLTWQGLWPVGAARSKPFPSGSNRWCVASADCETVRVTGYGTVSEAWAYVGSGSVDIANARVLAIASLADETAENIRRYYLSAPDGSGDWEKRVRKSAPLHRLPSDSEHPGDPAPDPERLELFRIRTLVGPPPGTGSGAGAGVQGVAEWCRKAYMALDSGERGTITGEAGGTTVSQPADETYLQASVDPGVARWQGLSGTLDGEPEPTDAPNRIGLAAALVPVFQLLGPGQSPAPPTGAEEFYNKTIPGFTGLQDTTRNFPQLEDGSRWDLSLLVVPLPYLPECPQDKPASPQLLPLGSSWNAVTTDRWSATVGLDHVVPRGEVAFVQTEPTRATMHPGDPGAPEPMIAGFSKPYGRHIVTAAGIEGEHPSITVGVCLQDWLGRWGDMGETVIERPARPPVPPPQGSTLVIPGPVPAGDGPASSATVRAEITVHRPAGPGAVPLNGLRVAVPREPVPRLLPIGPGDVGGIITRTVEFPARETTPGEVAVETLTLQSTGVDGGASSAVSVTARIVDPRPVRAPVASPRLIAATRRGNSPAVTVALAITAAPNARAYRVLVASETTLRSAFGLPAPAPAEPRAERAATVRRAMAVRDQRRFYSWASTNTFPVQDGAALATFELPAGTDGVVFARAVAVTTIPGTPPTEAVSTPFERTEPVAIVVPRSEFPPVPDIETSPGDDGTAAVTVRVTRPPADLLSSLQIQGKPAAKIQARLVEYLADAEPVYWHEIKILDLEKSSDDPPVYEGKAKLQGRPWQRTAVAACVRYPAEPTLAAGDIIITGEVRAAGLQYEEIPSPWGPYSTPVWIDFRGAVPTVRTSFIIDGVSVTATGLPALPPGAPVWTMQLLRLAPEPGPFGDPVPASTGLTLRPRPHHSYAVLLTDPFGGQHGPVPLLLL